MGTHQQFNLRWNNHTNNILQVFLEQFSSETLVDVTLSCQGQFLRAHKMVLSACSPYFQDLFQVHQVQHPVIIMNGMKFNDIKQIIDFMYKGEVKVLEAELDGLLAAAETLQVKGLSHVRNKYRKGDIQGSDSAVSANSEPPPLEPCLPAAPPPPPPPPPPPVSTSSSVSNQAVTQSKPQVAPPTKTQSALPPPLTPTSSSSNLLPTTRVRVPPAVSTKRKKSPEPPLSKAENAAKKQNCRTVPQIPTQKISATPSSEKDNNDDDDDFPTTIKVEPLDIRDIDEEQPWEPHGMVIDMKEEGSKKSTTVNTVRPSLLKFRSASDLDSVRADDPHKENEPKKEPLVVETREWRGNKRVTRIPRPPNAFMIFANEWRRKLALENPSDSNKDISVRLGIKWKNLSAEKKALYYSASRVADEEHKRKYPNYYYSPKEARLRKSAQQNLRRRLLGNAASPPATPVQSAKAMQPDPLRFVKVFMKDPTTRGVFVAVEGSKLATTATASGSTGSTKTEGEGNLEEEFLKMVEEGQVEAEVQGDMAGELDGLTEAVGEEEVGGQEDEQGDSDTDTKPVLTEELLMLQQSVTSTAEHPSSNKKPDGE